MCDIVGLGHVLHGSAMRRAEARAKRRRERLPTVKSAFATKFARAIASAAFPSLVRYMVRKVSWGMAAACCLVSATVWAGSYTAATNGIWTSFDTWGLGSGYPSSGDDAYVYDHTVQINHVGDCANLYLQGAAIVSISAGCVFRTSSGLYSDGGDLTGSGALVNDGTFARISAATCSIGCAFTNNGTVNHSDSGDLSIGATFHNTGAGAYCLLGDGSISGTGTFRNSGTLSKSGGSGTNAVNAQFFNAGGTVEVLTGAVRLSGTTTLADGIYTAQGGSVLEFSAGGAFGGTLAGAGTGTVHWTGGTVTGNAAADFSNGFHWRGGTLNGTLDNFRLPDLDGK